MSTDYRTMDKISFADLFDGRLERFEVREHIKAAETSNTQRCLTDGRNYLWVYAECDGTVGSMTTFGASDGSTSDFTVGMRGLLVGGNAPGRILGAIAKTFDTYIISEHEPQYWGFDTQEEWDLALKKIAEEGETKFHAEIIKYVTGGPNDLKPGTIGMIQAKIAKDLVTENPGLVSPDKKEELMEAIEKVYKADHAVVIHLDDRDIAAARMAMTHEDDLPQA